MIHNTEETGSGRMQIDGGLRGIFQQQAAKTKAKPTFWKTVRLLVDSGVGGGQGELAITPATSADPMSWQRVWAEAAVGAGVLEEGPS